MHKNTFILSIYIYIYSISIYAIYCKISYLYIYIYKKCARNIHIKYKYNSFCFY